MHLCKYACAKSSTGMRRYLACSSYANVMHRELAITHALRYDASAYTCSSVLACMQNEEFEMHASTKIIVVTGIITELHAGRQQVHFSILQPFLLTTYGNNRCLENIVSDK